MLLTMNFVLIFPTDFSQTFFIQRRIQTDIVNAHVFSCKVPVILVKFSKNSHK